MTSRSLVALFVLALAATSCNRAPSSSSQSPTAEPDAAAWTGFSDPRGRFQCELPGTPVASPVEASIVPLDVWTLHVDPDTHFTIAVTQYGTVDSAKLEHGFDSARDILLRNQSATLVSEEHVALSGVPGRSVTAKLTSGRIMRSRMFYDGRPAAQSAPHPEAGVFYQLVVTAPPATAEAAASRFFESFSLGPK